MLRKVRSSLVTKDIEDIPADGENFEQLALMLNGKFVTVHLTPTDGITTLSWWRGLRVPVNLRARRAVALLPAGSPMPDRSRG
jgi:hypothetical protein